MFTAVHNGLCSSCHLRNPLTGLDLPVVSPCLPPQADHTRPPIFWRPHTEHNRYLARYQNHGEEGQSTLKVGINPSRPSLWADETAMSRIEHGFRTMRNQDDINTYRQVRRDCEGMGIPVKNYSPGQAPTFGGVAAHGSSSNSYYPPSARRYRHFLRRKLAFNGSFSINQFSSMEQPFEPFEFVQWWITKHGIWVGPSPVGP